MAQARRSGIARQWIIAVVPHPLPTGKGWGKDVPCQDCGTCDVFRREIRPPPFEEYPQGWGTRLLLLRMGSSLECDVLSCDGHSQSTTAQAW